MELLCLLLMFMDKLQWIGCHVYKGKFNGIELAFQLVGESFGIGGCSFNHYCTQNEQRPF